MGLAMKIYSLMKKFPNYNWDNLQPFVFKNSGSTPCLLDALGSEESPKSIHALFAFFSIEVENGFLMSTFTDIRKKLEKVRNNKTQLMAQDFKNHEIELLKEIYKSLDCESKEFKNQLMNQIFEEILNGYDINIDLIVVKEIAPNEFEFIVNIHSTERLNTPEKTTTLLCNNQLVSFLETGELISNENPEFAFFKNLYADSFSLASVFVDRIYTNAQGTIQTHHFVKRKINGVKTKFKFSNIIYVSNNKKKEKINTGIAKNIQWLNSWSVRGHWRTLPDADAMGKDRIGERTIAGKTWIAPYRKGEGKLITKVRKV